MIIEKMLNVNKLNILTLAVKHFIIILFLLNQQNKQLII